MTLPPLAVRRRVRKLHALMGSSNIQEAGIAMSKLKELLAAHGLSWNDLPAVLAAMGDASAEPATTPAAEPPRGPDLTAVNVLDLVDRLIEDHVTITAEERLAVVLWILHTHLFDQYAVSPRLALLSPVKGCGKTTLLSLLALLAHEPCRLDSVTAAWIYHQLACGHRTIFIDEGDNLGLAGNGVLRAVLNSGHRRGGSVARLVGGRPVTFPTFGPLAVAAIGDLPLPLVHRSVVINMRRDEAKSARREYDELDPVFPIARELIRKWAQICVLARDPEMPDQLRNRSADNWRVLLAIADSLGHGDEARAAAIKLCSDRPDEDVGVVLLGEIQTIFLVRGLDRVTSADLVEALLGLDDGFWNEWRGPKDDRPARKLNQTGLAEILRPFGIRSRTIWAAGRRPGDSSKRGFYRSQFEDAWRRYCPPADTPTQLSKISA